MDSSHAQVAADIALGATASPARLTRSGHSTPSHLTLLKPAQLAFSAAKSEVAWGAADDAAAAKKISDEAAAAKVTAMEEDFRKMSAMVQELARDLGAERAARLQLEETILATLPRRGGQRKGLGEHKRLKRLWTQGPLRR